MGRARIGTGTCGLAAGAGDVMKALDAWLSEQQPAVQLTETGCLGLCYREVLVELPTSDGGRVLYGDVTVENVGALCQAHFEGRPVEGAALVPIDDPQADDGAFLQGQERVALARCGSVDPGSLQDYRAHGGFAALEGTLASMSPDAVIELIERSGLRGRGGGGFPTGRKWRLAAQHRERDPILIANADEGDPGAFMDRNLLEGDPFAVLEGMMLAAYAIGASQGIVYVRAEYPLAVRRLNEAIGQAREAGFLGDSILGSEFAFDIALCRGAGAFVCGEETAMIAALEGRRGIPRLRPPYPVESGLWGRPTCVGNVETLANVPWILANGPEAFSRHGVGESLGTKVFSLAGDVVRGGLVEVPMGMSIHQLVLEVGGGSPSGKPLKAVQMGGPSGGCLPASMFDTPIDYESLLEYGAMMGSGGVVVLDESRCMVDMARYFLKFTQRESCGQCTFCRVGTLRMLEILERLCAGEARKTELDQLEQLARQVGEASLCGLGKTAPNPVLSTLRWFRSEYEAHVHRCCPAGVCRGLIRYEIDRFMCDGCTLCSEQCPADSIQLVRTGQTPLKIDLEVCIKCGGCFEVCRFNAVSVQSGD